MAPTLGYWQIRGLAEALRLILHYKEVEFEDKRYGQGAAPDFSREEWYKEKFTLGLDLPNLPYYIDGDLKLTETGAIFAYLGRKHGLDGSSEAAKMRNDMTFGVAGEFQMALIMVCYNPEFEKLKGPFLESLPGRLEKLSKWLGDNEYFGGSELVYSDFCVYDLLDTFNNFEPGCVGKYENLKTYMARIEALPTVKKYISSESYMRTGPFYSKIAKWGDKAL